MIGDHFAVVTSEDRWVYEMERHLMDCKMRNFSITLHPVRALTISLETLFSCLGGNYEPVVEDFKKVAKTCIQDGADVIITGCGLVSPMITQSGNSEIGGVPVIDPMLVSLKVAELMVDFYRAGLPLKNASGRFLRPVAEQVHEIRKAIGL
jgi:Asp/Glu/hydantoin racemase